MKNAISGNSIIVASKDQIFCDMEKEVVILNLKNGLYFTLDGAGNRIWNLIQEPKPVSEIQDVVLAEYEIEPDQCKQDILALLEELAAEGLIEVKDKAVV